MKTQTKNPQKKAYVVVGPTAVGKTAYAIELAERHGGEVVSADSMQIYRGMDIGTAKPSPAELARVPHHMIGIVDPARGFSVAEYREMAGRIIEDIFRRGKTPVVAGGTGLYVNSLLYDMDFSGAGAGQNEALRRELEEAADLLGDEHIHQRLADRDPAAAARIHPHNRKRVIRALERIESLKGEGAAEGGDHSDACASLKPFEEAFRPGTLFQPDIRLLIRDRAELYARIDARVDILMEAGLLEEVGRLRDSGLRRSHIAMLGIGYKELLSYFDGDSSLKETVELIKRNSRRYAKRQLTWFRRYENAKIIDLTGR